MSDADIPQTVHSTFGEPARVLLADMASDQSRRLIRRAANHHKAHGAFEVIQPHGERYIKVTIAENQWLNPSYLPAGLNVHSIKPDGIILGEQ